MHRPLAIALALAALLFSGAASAQRGETFIEQASPPQGPLSGFPGLLDANTVDRGHLVADLPFLSLDYGVTENLSVGTNLVAMLPLVAGQPSLVARTRYRLYSSRRVTSVLDGYGGYFSLSQEEEETEMSPAGTSTFRAWLTLLGTNTAIRLSERQTVTLSGLGLHLSGSSSSPGDPPGFSSKQSMTALLVAASYQLELTDWLAARASALTLPLITGEIDTSAQNVSLEIGADDDLHKRTLWRLLLSARLGNWLLTAGGIATFDVSGGIPWLSVAKRW